MGFVWGSQDSRGGYWISDSDFATGYAAGSAGGKRPSGRARCSCPRCGQIKYRKMENAWAVLMQAKTAENWPLVYELAKAVR